MFYLIINYKRKTALQEAFRVAFALTLSVFLYKFFNMQEGVWILITTGFIYIGVSINGEVIARTKDRVIGAPLGILCSAAIMALFSWYDYRATYIIVIFFPIAFYFFFITGRYFFFVFFVMLVFTLYENYSVPVSEYVNWSNVIFSRIFCTFIGCVIVTLGEFLIFPHSTTVKRSLPYISEKVLHGLSRGLLSFGTAYSNRSAFKKQQYQLHLQNILEEINNMHQMCNAAKAEVMHREEEDKYYDNFIIFIHDIFDSIRKLVFISMHSDIKKGRHNDSIREYTEYLSDVILKSFHFAVPPDTIEKYNSIFSLNEKDSISAEETLTIESLFDLGSQVNIFIENIINIEKN